MTPERSPGADRDTGRWITALLCVYLAGLTWVVFGQTLRAQFVNLDDEAYVKGNKDVLKGLSVEGIVGAFKHPVMYLWTPLTTLSHSVDYQLYGLSPAGHHLTNVLLHIATVVLLFLVLRRMTGGLWQSVFVAAVFAIHPLRVESVAWVAERKDVLSGVFFMATLGAYVRYVRAPTLGRHVAMALCFALGLMVKPILVTLPCVLLLLDYWPLGRWAGAAEKSSGVGKLVVEKLPLFLLSAASCLMTVFGGDIAPHPNQLPFPARLRLGNAVVSYVTYLGQMIYPAGLALLYPFPQNGQPVVRILLAACILGSLTAFFFWRRQRQPYLLVGWLWYLGMLAPVTGVIQMGRESHADRYTYLPQIGIYILITWAVADLSVNWRRRSALLGSLAAVVIGALTVCARVQASYWADSEALWRRSLRVTAGDPMAHFSLGNALLEKGEADEAIVEYRKMLKTNPAYSELHRNLGEAYARKGLLDTAIAEYQTAIRLQPDSSLSHYNLGNILLKKGERDAAISEYILALQSRPDYPEAEMNLGTALRSKGLLDEAIRHFRKALELSPENPEANYDLGNALIAKGAVGEAVARLEKAVEVNPEFIPARNSLAWLLATTPQLAFRNGPEALGLATQTMQLSDGKNPELIRTLAAAYAQAGQFSTAATAAGQALELASAQGNTDLAEALQGEKALYEAGFAYRAGAR